MAHTVRIFFTALMVYLGSDHCSDCRPEGKAATGRNSVRRILNESDFDRAPLCGRRFYDRDELRRQVNDDNNSTVDTEDDPHLDKIYGGLFASYGEFPWTANILYKDEHYCGGGIISEFWIVTAAHCIKDAILEMYTVVVGDYTLSRIDEYEVRHRVQTMVFHTEYRKEHFDYDIGLIKVRPDLLGRGIQFNNYVQPFCLARATEDPQEYRLMTVTGWGSTDETGDQSDILKRIDLRVIPYDACKRLSPLKVTPNMFCLSSGGHEGTCPGDSGGPAYSEGYEGVVLYGVVSYGNLCGNYNKNTVFSSIVQYRRWIDTQIRENSRGLQGLMPVRRHPPPM